MNVGWIIEFFQIGKTLLILIGMILINLILVVRVGVDVVWVDVIQIYRIFAPNFFNFKNIIALSIFENAVVYRIFTLGFCCAMARRAPVWEIWRPYFEEAKANGVSWWDFVTAIPPAIAIPPNSSTTLQTGNL